MLKKRIGDLTEARKHTGVFSLLFATIADVLMIIRPVHKAKVDETALPESNGETIIFSGDAGTSAWLDGCSSTAAGDIAEFYDQEHYPNNNE